MAKVDGNNAMNHEKSYCYSNLPQFRACQKQDKHKKYRRFAETNAACV